MNALLLTLLVATPDAGVPPPVLPEFRRLAVNLAPMLESPWVKDWLSAVNELKPVKPSTWYCAQDKQTCASKEPPDAGYSARVVDDEYVYARITEPLGYARPLDVLAAAGFSPKGKKVLDFGYGNIGQLLMLSRLGAEVHGVEVDALIPLATRSVIGKVVLHHGFFAGDAKLVKELGGGFDLFMSKNTLKRGYVHPAQPKDAKGQIDLGLDDQKVLGLIFGMLKPGAFFYIYNLAPAQAEPYKPMADGRCPWSREVLQAAGFEVLAYDADDSTKARQMGHLLEWDAEGDDLQKTLFATYTLLRRPVR
ncbi:MAG: hypothetical protein Q8L48_23100 [Archangium sp.]|nr:hypothetical protein [Archangium sp.]